MRAKLVFLVVHRWRTRQVVQCALLDPIGVRNFLLPVAILHTLERLDALPLYQPAAAVQLEVFLAVVDNLLL